MAKKTKAKKVEKGEFQQALVQPLADSHGKTVQFIGDLRKARKKFPLPLRDVFPRF
jgi:hypothetical protein